jgi:cytochrome c oxidase subunit IV
MNHHTTPIRTYFVVYAVLLVLLALTVLVAYLDLGPWGVILALAIAIVKALLVILYFMHVRASNPLVWVFAGAGFLWLAILLAGIMQDYISRGWIGS